jgi:hypothetical protein
MLLRKTENAHHAEDRMIRINASNGKMKFLQLKQSVLARSRRGWEDNIKMDFREIAYDGIDSIDFT